METKKVVTRFDEIRFRQSEPKSMVGKMLAESVCRKWTKDFLDKSTGEVVSIERTETILSRGKVLTKDDVATIQFYQSEGSVKDVLVTNQDRPFKHIKFGGKYEVGVKTNSSKKLLVYARSIQMAIDIAIDYCEQTAQRDFIISSVKAVDDFRVIHYKPEDEDNSSYHIVTIEHFDQMAEQFIKSNFLTLAKDADQSIDIVRAFIEKEKLEDVYGESGEYSIVAAKKSPITEIVPTEMTEVYIKYDDANALIMDGQRISQSVTD